MRSLNTKLLACWLFLAAFLAGNCFGPRGILLCADASGSTQLEIGCANDLGGDCRSAELSIPQFPPDSTSISAPCTDTQLRSGEVSAQPPARCNLVPPAFILAALHEPAPVIARPRRAVFHAERAAPPDTQNYLRSVVIVI